MFCATMQLGEGTHTKHFHLILQIKQLHYLGRQFQWETHNISCVDSQGAQKLFVAVGATPLVSQSICIMDVLQLCPHVHHLPAQPIRNQVIIQKKQLSSLEYLFWFLVQVTYYTFQLNLRPGTIPRGTKTAQCSQNNYSPDFLLENDVHGRQDKACLGL